MVNYSSKYPWVKDEINNQGYSLFSIDGNWHSSDDEAVQSIIDSFDELIPAKAMAKARMVEQSQAFMSKIESEYPSFEKKTWPTQKAEVEAWGEDKSHLTPFLDNIATAREMERVTLLDRTLVKVKAYNIYAAHLAGKRQKLEDVIESSSDLEFISSVNFEG